MPHNQLNTHGVVEKEKPLSNMQCSRCFRENGRSAMQRLVERLNLKCVKEHLHACTIVDPAKRNVNKKPGFIVWFEAMFKRFHTNHNDRQCQRITVCTFAQSLQFLYVGCYLLSGSQFRSTDGHWSAPLPLPPPPFLRSAKKINWCMLGWC